jgi:glycosyltransferase involved in cell wall biosynthesis
MIDLNLQYIVLRYSHHSPHSGYDRLADYWESMYGGSIIRVDKPLPRSIIRERMLWRVANGTPGYDRASMAAELKVAWNMTRERGNIYHFLYGETTYHYIGLLNNFRKHRVIATFHLPPSGIRQAAQIDWHIRRLTAVVCVGQTQQEYFTNILGQDRVFILPHGVDTQYYTPPKSFETRNPDLCLFVGDNYRDFPTLRGVIELVAYKRPRTQFVVVTARRNYELIGLHPNLTLRSGIPESELLNLYHSAALMIMPLHDATANNAILESIACGLPVVVSDVGSIRDYVDPECAMMVAPYDSLSMVDAILDLLEDPQMRQHLGNVSRERSLRFSWPNIVQQLQLIYSAVI